MKRSPFVPLLAILTVAIAGVITTLVTDSSPGLGLDLKGGASVVLEPVGNVDAGKLDQTIGVIRRRIDALGVAEPDIARQGTAIVVQLPGIKDTERALQIVGQTAELRFRPVLQTLPSANEMKAQKALASATTTTLKGGTPTSTIKGATTTTVKGATTTTVNGATTTTAGGVTTTAGVTTTTPGATTTAGATTTVGVTTTAPAFEAAPAGGFGSFAIQAQTTTGPAATTAPATTAPATTAPATTGPATTVKGATATTVKGATTTVTPSTVKGATTTTSPIQIIPTPSTTVVPQIPLDFKTTPPDKDQKDAFVILPLDPTGDETLDDTERYYLAPAELTGEIVSDARAELAQNGQWQVIADFTGKGSGQWNAMAAKYLQKQIAIVLDGIVKSAPVIQTTEFNGSAQITGTFTEREAKDLATVLRFGSLPVQLKPQTVQTVSATLGRDSLNAGLIAGLVGLALVAAYMLFYYRTLGLVVVLGLCLSGALMWSLVTWLSASRGLALSLSGAVGIIVSVGVTVDSYVVYFEKMRDEMRSGKSVATAVDKGFNSAWHTIRTADLTSIIGALVLYVLTVGSVRGFAFFLMLSTALDIVVTYFFTRPFVKIIAARGWFSARTLGVEKLLPTAEASTASGVLRPGSTNSSTGVRS